MTIDPISTRSERLSSSIQHTEHVVMAWFVYTHGWPRICSLWSSTRTIGTTTSIKDSICTIAGHSVAFSSVLPDCWWRKRKMSESYSALHVGIELEIFYHLYVTARQPNRPFCRLGARSADRTFFFSIPPTGRRPFSGQCQSYDWPSSRPTVRPVSQQYVQCRNHSAEWFLLTGQHCFQ